MKRFVRRPSPAMLVALAALFVALGGTAYAQLVITGQNIRNGTVFGSDIANKALHGRDVEPDSLGRIPIMEERLDTSKLGQVNSARAADGVFRHAVVAANGSTTRSRGVSSTARTGEGSYQVILDRDVRGCAYVATIGDPSAAAPGTGQVATSALPTNVNGVRVHTRNSDGVASDRDFHLLVSC